ncbi:MAG: glycine cleavage system protein GcvH [Gammaproteobacteria bacterium]|uniref:glycine cleavage system protein GcvH n=1 Tax=Thiomicrorhabdus cannonii TaxID=2748011 RepID=UPI0015B9D010|nr:glycine cleavage system protein GcvH [Thiomicrorhabdus cannonii]MBD3754893.1 glycine cleavage system protein GcvH [Gammaproteobacteria bacterium]MBD3776253.1 glycine cleavage system protein GcvH [Thiotrichales bacterium]
MSVLPSHLKYAETHEWVYIDEQGNAVVGITDFAQESLGDLMSVTFPELGADVTAGDEVMSLESVKAASEIYAPLSGEIVAINEALEDEPELINEEPYDAGWLFKIAPHDVTELEELMSDSEYQDLIDQA